MFEYHLNDIRTIFLPYLLFKKILRIIQHVLVRVAVICTLNTP